MKRSVQVIIAALIIITAIPGYVTNEKSGILKGGSSGFSFFTGFPFSMMKVFSERRASALIITLYLFLRLSRDFFQPFVKKKIYPPGHPAVRGL